VLLLLIVLSITVAAGFARIGAERRTNSAQRAQTAAFALAQGGVEQYLASTTMLPTSFPATTTYNLAGGTAAVTLYRVKDDAIIGSRVYAIKSVGRNSAGSRPDDRTAVSERAIVQLVKRQQATMDIDAAFTSLSGLNKNGISGLVSGVDQCAVQPPIPGLATPDGLYTPPNTNANANDYIDGNPDNAPDYLGPTSPGSSTPGTANGEVDVDWASIVDGSAMTPDFHINRSVSPATGAFPSTYVNWPVVRITGNMTNGDNFNGQGLLIVTGDADFSNVTWRGVAFVGGQADVSGSGTRVFGSIVTGLNLKLSPLSAYPFLPQTYPAESSIGNGNFQVQYNSCDVASALNALGGWQRIANGWADNWPTY
jgi:hypothetical protein